MGWVACASCGQAELGWLSARERAVLSAPRCLSGRATLTRMTSAMREFDPTRQLFGEATTVLL